MKKYSIHRSSVQTSKRSNSWKFILVVILLLVIASLLLVLLIRSNRQFDDPIEEDPIIEEVAVQVEVIPEDDEPEVIEQTTSTFEEINLDYVETEGIAGFARRGTEGDLFTHVIVAELPFIDLSTEFYEGWLVKPGVTEFFSTGEMFSRADGKFGLVYEIPLESTVDDIFLYYRVVITRELRDGDDAPSPHHIADGDF